MAWLQRLRQERGLSQRDLESLTGVSRSEIHKIETNQQECRLSSFVKICAELGVPPGWMIDLVNDSNQGLLNQAVLNDAGFLGLLENLQIPTNDLQRRLAEQISQTCCEAIILLRSSAPVRRLPVLSFPNQEIRTRFEAFVFSIENGMSPGQRSEHIEGLRRKPVAELQRLGLLSHDWIRSFAVRISGDSGARSVTAGSWGQHVLNLEDVRKILGIAQNDQKKDLTVGSLKSNSEGVKSEIEKLIELVKGKASKPGAKAELARTLGVAPARISEWLSGEKEPGGEYTLKLLHWVKSPERQIKKALAMREHRQSEDPNHEVQL